MSARTRKPRLLSLCSGIGGIDLAAEMAGFDIAGQCELDPFCQQVLARHWPDVQRVSDIRNVWGDSFDGGPIDLVAGGIPCQPWSVAGKRRGANDDRHLWPEMRRIIAIYQPAWVLVENVAGFARLALDSVLTDLGSAGYEAGAVVLPAAAVGAPHLRERVFIVAHAAQHSQPIQPQVNGAGRALDGASARTGGGTQRRNPAARVSDHGRVERERAGYVAHAQRLGRPGRSGEQGGNILHRQTPERHEGERDAGDGYANDRGDDGQTESALGRGVDGVSRRLDGTSRDDSSLSYPYQPWPAGPGEAQHEWEAPRVSQERIPNRAARLKALGNAVVPAQVYPILRAIYVAQMSQSGGEVA